MAKNDIFLFCFLHILKRSVIFASVMRRNGVVKTLITRNAHKMLLEKQARRTVLSLMQRKGYQS